MTKSKGERRERSGESRVRFPFALSTSPLFSRYANALSLPLAGSLLCACYSRSQYFIQRYLSINKLDKKKISS